MGYIIKMMMRYGVFLLFLTVILISACKQPEESPVQKPKVDKTQLLNMIGKAQSLYDSLEISVNGEDVCESKYWIQDSKWDLFLAIENAQAVYDMSDVSQIKTNDALLELTDVYDRFNTVKQKGKLAEGNPPIEEDPPIDDPPKEEPVVKDELRNAIAAAKAKMQGVQSSVNNGLDICETEYWVGKEIFDTLLKIIAEAEEVNDNEDAKQEEVDAMVTALETAVNAFVPEPGKWRGIALLSEEIDKAYDLLDSLQTSENNDGNDIHKSQYWVTDEAVSEFKEEILAARDVLNNPGASQEEVDNARERLIAACENFFNSQQPGKSEIDRSILKQAITEAKTKMNGVVAAANGSELLNTQKWASEEMFAALLAAVAEAENTYSDEYITQEEVDAMIPALHAAIAAFVPQPGLLTSGGISYTFTGPRDETITLAGTAALSWAKNDTLQISVIETFDNYQWYVNGVIRLEEKGKSITLFARDFSVNTHSVTLRVTKNGVPYTKTLYFSVE